jgi:HD-GYP domain-containing protein (c-di-GMP phosphodiesterase class II)
MVAMTSDRPYAERHDTATALDELNRAAGSQFDPQVVAALEQAIRQPASVPGQTS